ncbi:MAG: NAD-dependent SIR2 family protein deacetylase [Gammaproteobacteria bacterium]|jgi:NAD-dependent SIR2 family protein deacetylase
MQCANYCEGIWNNVNFEPVIDEANCRLESELPVCPQCGLTARPNVVMFGGFNWQYELYDRQQRRDHRWLKQVDKLVVIELGAGIHIPTVRDESERRAGQHLIRINLRSADIPGGRGISLEEGALAALNMIDEYINP